MTTVGAKISFIIRTGPKSWLTNANVYIPLLRCAERVIQVLFLSIGWCICGIYAIHAYYAYDNRGCEEFDAGEQKEVVSGTVYLKGRSCTLLCLCVSVCLCVCVFPRYHYNVNDLWSACSIHDRVDLVAHLRYVYDACYSRLVCTGCLDSWDGQEKMDVL